MEQTLNFIKKKRISIVDEAFQLQIDVNLVFRAIKSLLSAIHETKQSLSQIPKNRNH